jgi:hypothetical protein
MNIFVAAAAILMFARCTTRYRRRELEKPVD